jgi:hypothetical protein
MNWITCECQGWVIEKIGNNRTKKSKFNVVHFRRVYIHQCSFCKKVPNLYAVVHEKFIVCKPCYDSERYKYLFNDK